MKNLPLKKIGLGLLVLFVLLQFYRIDKTNPPIDTIQDFMTIEKPPGPISEILKNACYDCHSYESKYPWYTNIMPFSYWIKGHIDHGREHLNFSTWGTYSANKKQHKLEECAEFVTETKMPLASYLIAHSEARISKEQRKVLADWCLTLKK